MIRQLVPWTTALLGLAFFGWVVVRIITRPEPTVLNTNGGQDRLFCEAYCHDGGGYLAEFGNGERDVPRCSCFAAEADPE